MIKAKIYKELGDVDIQLYRDGLKDFLKNRYHSIHSIIENCNLGNNIKNYYVITKIEQRLKSLFEQVKNDYFTKVNTFPYESLNLKHAIKESKPFISYIIEESYNDN